MTDYIDPDAEISQDNPPRLWQTAALAAGEQAEPGRKPSPLQVELTRARDQCETYSRLCQRLQGVLVALRGPGPKDVAYPQTKAPATPRNVSIVEGTRFVNDCNTAVQREMERVVEELELLLDIAPGQRDAA